MSELDRIDRRYLPAAERERKLRRVVRVPAVGILGRDGRGAPGGVP